MELSDILAQTGGLQSMARELGIGEAEAARAASALAPAVLGGFTKQAQAHPQGVEGLGGMLSQFGGGGMLDAVLSPYDGISIGILSSLKGVGYCTAQQPCPIVTGQDAEVPSVKSILKGEQTSTVFKDTRELAKVAANMVDAVLTGKQPEINDTKTYNNGVKVVPSYLLKPVAVDASNWNKVLVGSGYYKESQIKYAARP